MRIDEIKYYKFGARGPLIRELRKRGYKPEEISFSGDFSEVGYDAFVLDDSGHKILSSDGQTIKTRRKPWINVGDWEWVLSHVPLIKD